MKAYVKSGTIIATHDEWQEVTATSYGKGITVYIVPNSAKPGEKISEYPDAEKETTE